MGKDIIIWENSSDEISVMDAYCPHLGAHLASGGKIVGDNIRCAFHHHKFNKKGYCVNKKNEYIYSYYLDIQGGIVFAWFHYAQEKPSWKLPNLLLDENNREWAISHTRLHGTRIPSHPMTFIENGADINHGIKLHGLCHKDTEFEVIDEKIYLRYIRNKESKGSIKLSAYGPFILSYDFNFTYYFKGYSRMLMLLQLNSDGSFIAHRIKMKHKKLDKFHMKLFYFGASIMTELKLFKAFITEDQLIMINRKYLSNPNYDKEDMFIPKFRKWYKQFYPTKR
jgi:phenylpropionate dioxygenase-like ring-hydroxylating dioxygenase large terminal subunit